MQNKILDFIYLFKGICFTVCLFVCPLLFLTNTTQNPFAVQPFIGRKTASGHNAYHSGSGPDSRCAAYGRARDITSYRVAAAAYPARAFTQSQCPDNYDYPFACADYGWLDGFSL